MKGRQMFVETTCVLLAAGSDPNGSMFADPNNSGPLFLVFAPLRSVSISDDSVDFSFACSRRNRLRLTEELIEILLKYGADLKCLKKNRVHKMIIYKAYHLLGVCERVREVGGCLEPYLVLRQRNFRQNFTRKFPETFGTKV